MAMKAEALESKYNFPKCDVSDLFGSMIKHLAAARAWERAMNPQVIFYDEPTTE
jgi:ABC-type transporter Mla maintaining outer membrane lipid asymmetry ATPase subunit MlaF